METVTKTIDVGGDFYPLLANRDKRQRDGEHTAIEFRRKYLKHLDKEDAWENDDIEVVLNFANVRTIGPSFANEAFAYFTRYTKPMKILQKIKIVNASLVQRAIIEQELETGYT